MLFHKHLYCKIPFYFCYWKFTFSSAFEDFIKNSGIRQFFFIFLLTTKVKL